MNSRNGLPLPEKKEKLDQMSMFSVMRSASSTVPIQPGVVWLAVSASASAGISFIHPAPQYPRTSYRHGQSVVVKLKPEMG